MTTLTKAQQKKIERAKNLISSAKLIMENIIKENDKVRYASNTNGLMNALGLANLILDEDFTNLD